MSVTIYFPDNVVLIAGHPMPPAHILKADSELNEMRPKNIFNFPIMYFLLPTCRPGCSAVCFARPDIAQTLHTPQNT